MKPLRRFWNRLRGTITGAEMEDVTAEIEPHVRMQTDDNLRAGMSVHEARRAAVLKFGSVDSTKERYRDERTFPLVISLASDLRFALRSIRREPRLTGVPRPHLYRR